MALIALVVVVSAFVAAAQVAHADTLFQSSFGNTNQATINVDGWVDGDGIGNLSNVGSVRPAFPG